MVNKVESGMRNKLRVLVWLASSGLVSLGLLVPVNSVAQAITHIYIGAGGFKSEFERDGTSATFDFLGGQESFTLTPENVDDNGWQLTYGYQFRKHFAVEGVLFDAGEFQQRGAHSVDSALLGPFLRFVVDDQEQVIEDTEEFFHPVSYDGVASTRTSFSGFSVIGVGIWPISQRFSLRAKLGFSFISGTTKYSTTDAFPDVVVEDVLFIDDEGEIFADDYFIEGSQVRNSGTQRESDIPLVYGLSASYRFTRDLSVEAFWLRQQSVGGGILGRGGDLDVTGAQLIYHY